MAMAMVATICDSVWVVLSMARNVPHRPRDDAIKQARRADRRSRHRSVIPQRIVLHDYRYVIKTTYSSTILAGIAIYFLES
jgi:hypothetical protein